MATLAVDWDDTLVDARSQEWLPDAQAALFELHALGYRILIHSCRTSWPEGLASIEAKLQEAGLAAIVEIHVADGKPVADKYIDDRGITFPGVWAPVLAHMRAIVAHNRIEKAKAAHVRPTPMPRTSQVRRSPFETLRPLA